MKYASGDRLGSYIVFRDAEGRRHAVRQTAVLGVHETDEMQTAVSLPGGRIALLPERFGTVIEWLAAHHPR